jgi:hypothetical protein
MCILIEELRRIVYRRSESNVLRRLTKVQSSPDITPESLKDKISDITPESVKDTISEVVDAAKPKTDMEKFTETLTTLFPVWVRRRRKDSL